MSEQGQVSTEHSPFARRIGSRLELATASHPQGWIRAWTLRIVPVTLIFPALMNLVVGNLAGIVGVAVAFGCCYGAVRLMEAGGEAELDFQGRTIAKAPRVPRKLLSSIVLGLGVVVAAAASAGIELGFALGGIACLGSVLAYGLDPREDKGINPKIAARAGVKLKTLVKAITEAEGKLTDIDRAASVTAYCATTCIGSPPRVATSCSRSSAIRATSAARAASWSPIWTAPGMW